MFVCLFFFFARTPFLVVDMSRFIMMDICQDFHCVLTCLAFCNSAQRSSWISQSKLCMFVWLFVCKDTFSCCHFCHDDFSKKLYSCSNNFNYPTRHIDWTDLQLPLQQWGTSNVYLLVSSRWKVNIDEPPIVVMGL